MPKLLKKQPHSSTKIAHDFERNIGHKINHLLFLKTTPNTKNLSIISNIAKGRYFILNFTDKYWTIKIKNKYVLCIILKRFYKILFVFRHKLIKGLCLPYNKVYSSCSLSIMPHAVLQILIIDPNGPGLLTGTGQECQAKRIERHTWQVPLTSTEIHRIPQREKVTVVDTTEGCGLLWNIGIHFSIAVESVESVKSCRISRSEECTWGLHTEPPALP